MIISQLEFFSRAIHRRKYDYIVCDDEPLLEFIKDSVIDSRLKGKFYSYAEFLAIKTIPEGVTVLFLSCMEIIGTSFNYRMQILINKMMDCYSGKRFAKKLDEILTKIDIYVYLVSDNIRAVSSFIRDRLQVYKVLPIKGIRSIDTKIGYSFVKTSGASHGVEYVDAMHTHKETYDYLGKTYECTVWLLRKTNQFANIAAEVHESGKAKREYFMLDIHNKVMALSLSQCLAFPNKMNIEDTRRLKETANKKEILPVTEDAFKNVSALTIMYYVMLMCYEQILRHEYAAKNTSAPFYSMEALLNLPKKLWFSVIDFLEIAKEGFAKKIFLNGEGIGILPVLNAFMFLLYKRVFYIRYVFSKTKYGYIADQILLPTVHAMDVLKDYFGDEFDTVIHTSQYCKEHERSMVDSGTNLLKSIIERNPLNKSIITKLSEVLDCSGVSLMEL